MRSLRVEEQYPSAVALEPPLFGLSVLRVERPLSDLEERYSSVLYLVQMILDAEPGVSPCAVQPAGSSALYVRGALLIDPRAEEQHQIPDVREEQPVLFFGLKVERSPSDL